MNNNIYYQYLSIISRAILGLVQSTTSQANSEYTGNRLSFSTTETQQNGSIMKVF